MATTAFNAPTELRPAYPRRLDPYFAAYVREPEFKRTLQRIRREQNKRKFTSIAVLSVDEGEGKTFVTAALGLSYAALFGSDVLIFDSVSQTQSDSFFLKNALNFGAEGENTNGPGKIDVLTSRSIVHAARNGQREPRKFSTLAPHTHTVPISDFRAGEMLQAMRSEYELILLDTCAIASAGADNLDPLILAAHSDAAVLVSARPYWARERLQLLRKDLQDHEINLLGMIVNAKECA